jgi:diaminopimelate decarboxylase
MEILPSRQIKPMLETYGSPLYVYNEAILKNNITRLRQAFPQARLYHFTPSNRCPGILRIMRRHMDGMTATTPLGAQRALRYFAPQQVIVSGSNYSRVDFLTLLAIPGLRINCNSLEELRQVAQLQPGRGVGVRIDTGVKARVYAKEGEMDITLAQVSALENIDVKIEMIHCYAGTAQSNHNLVDSANTLCETVLRYPQVFTHLKAINIAGGIEFDDLTGTSPDVADYGRQVSALIENLQTRLGRPLHLILEPGRIIMASTASLYCHINQVYEKSGQPMIGIDATRFQFGDLSKFGKLDEDASFAIGLYDEQGVMITHFPEQCAGTVPLGIHGNTHYSKDRVKGVFVYPEDIARLKGGLFEIKYAGAYASSMTSAWADREMPAEVLYAAQGKITVLELRQHVRDVILSRIEKAQRGLRHGTLAATVVGLLFISFFMLGTGAGNHREASKTRAQFNAYSPVPSAEETISTLPAVHVLHKTEYE